MPRCAACGGESPEGARFCAFCGTPIPIAAETDESRKTVTVVFCDLAGSTRLGDRTDPELFKQVLARYYDAMRRVLERHGGKVEKFIGDAVVAVFGVPVLHEDDALRAVRAAAEMQSALAELNAQLQRDVGVNLAIRTGLNTGEVLVGGDAVLGDAVNIAARLEQAAGPGEILLGAPTYRLVRDAVNVEPVPPLNVKGKDQPVTAYRLLEVLDVTSTIPRRLDSPLVGRARELVLLQQAYARAVEERACALFTVLGSAGVGKSRLVAEFTGTVGADALILRGRCLSYGDGITFWPLAEIVRQAAGVAHADAPEAATVKVLALMGDDDDGRVVADRVAGLVGFGGTLAPMDEAAWAVRKMLEALAGVRPLAVIVDDIHWAEPALLDVLEHVAVWARDAPLLLVCLARPELHDVRPGWGSGAVNATSILLEPLAPVDTERLTDNLVATAGLESEVRARIVAAAEGNPLFVEQLVSMLIDDGLVKMVDGRWQAAPGLTDLPIPPTIDALVAARLDRLPAEERAVLERGAVVGKEFWLDPEEAVAAAPHLTALVRRQLLVPATGRAFGREVYRFRHQLVRDAVYARIPKQRRAELHQRFATWLESAAGERREEYEAILGYHLEQAYRLRSDLGTAGAEERSLAARAGSLLAAAGARAVERFDPVSADLLERAVGLLPDDDHCRPEALVEYGRAVFNYRGDPEQAGRLFREGLASARRLGDRVWEWRARLHLVQLSAVSYPERFSVADARSEVRQGIEALEADGDHRASTVAWGVLALIYLFEMRHAEVVTASERAMAHARRAGDEHLVARAMSWACWSLVAGPLPVPAATARLEAMLVPDLGPEGRAAVMAGLAMLAALAGRPDDAWRLAATHRAIRIDLGTDMGATSAFTEGRVARWTGDPIATETILTPRCHYLRDRGDKSFLSTLAALLAVALHQQGRDDEARHWLHVAEESGSPEDKATQIFLRAGRAEVLAAAGEFGPAEVLAGEAVALADSTDALVEQGEVRLALARVLRAAGRLEEAATAARQAAERFEAKAAAGLVRQAQALVAELAAAAPSTSG